MTLSRYPRVILLLWLGVLLWGCASSESARFYTLHGLQGKGGFTERKESSGNLILAVGPVKFPDHLNRPEVVTRVGQTRMNISEDHLWAGSLPENFMQVLVDNLSVLLARERVIVLTNRTRPGTVDYQLVMEIHHFEGLPGGDVSLVSRWTILRGKEKQWLFVQNTNITEPAEGAGYEALVAAQSRALERLSREIAESVQKLLR